MSTSIINQGLYKGARKHINLEKVVMRMKESYLHAFKLCKVSIKHSSISLTRIPFIDQLRIKLLSITDIMQSQLALNVSRFQKKIVIF
ncbi:hypothetical protein AF72_09095 [Xylella taiwanensis]|uniref:Uncharacterized protein n=1 Tax=Xylella taiwanensis TaxID=1444770 RepID=Z9JJ62_9GAMM|nr:hypothetical protein AB672_06550 [Xylella taiwanensis]EWS77802.1 hypothetical protein AF72_09095 [Xylella taiwanensis]